MFTAFERTKPSFATGKGDHPKLKVLWKMKQKDHSEVFQQKGLFGSQELFGQVTQTSLQYRDFKKRKNDIEIPLYKKYISILLTSRSQKHIQRRVLLFLVALVILPKR